MEACGGTDDLLRGRAVVWVGVSCVSREGRLSSDWGGGLWSSLPPSLHPGVRVVEGHGKSGRGAVVYGQGIGVREPIVNLPHDNRGASRNHPFSYTPLHGLIIQDVAAPYNDGRTAIR